jgi:hypothetical protein
MTQIDEKITFSVGEKTTILPNGVIVSILGALTTVLIWFMAHLNSNVETLIIKVNTLETKVEMINGNQNKVTSNECN